MQHHQQDFATIFTDRVQLRPLTDDDAPELLQLEHHREPFERARHDLRGIAEARKCIAEVTYAMDLGNQCWWAFANRHTAEFIGYGGFCRRSKAHARAELDFRIGTLHWGHTLSTEILSAMVRVGFEQLALHSIEVRVDPHNVRAIRALAWLGFRQEGRLTEEWFDGAAFADTLVFSLLKAWCTDTIPRTPRAKAVDTAGNEPF